MKQTTLCQWRHSRTVRFKSANLNPILNMDIRRRDPPKGSSSLGARMCRYSWLMKVSNSLQSAQLISTGSANVFAECAPQCEFIMLRSAASPTIEPPTRDHWLTSAAR